MANDLTAVERAFAAGDPEALSAAYSRWGAIVYTVALRGTGSATDAAEVTRDAFLAVWHRGFVAGQASLKAHLVATARALTHQRLRQRSDSLPDAEARELHQGADGAMDLVIVRDELTDLSEPSRTAVRAAVLDKQTTAAVAERLSLPPVEVNLALGQGVVRMRDALKGSYGDG